MTTAKHTPGPWRAVKPRNPYLQSWSVEAAGSVIVAETFEYSLAQPQAQANARLIAAAPHLLACLEDLTNAIEAAGLLAGEGDTFAEIRNEAASARAVLAKAEGEAP